MKAGTEIKVIGFDMRCEEIFEAAKVAPVTRAMRPVPSGYMPVRFDADGELLMVHESRIVAA